MFLLVFFSHFQAIFFYTLIEYEPLTYNETYVYPTWGYVLGWGMAVASMVQIPIYVVIAMLFLAEGTFKEVWYYVYSVVLFVCLN